MTQKGFRLLRPSSAHHAVTIAVGPPGALGTKGNCAVSTLWPPVPCYGSGSPAKHVRNFVRPYKQVCGYSVHPPVSVQSRIQCPPSCLSYQPMRTGRKPLFTFYFIPFFFSNIAHTHFIKFGSYKVLNSIFFLIILKIFSHVIHICKLSFLYLSHMIHNNLFYPLLLDFFCYN